MVADSLERDTSRLWITGIRKAFNGGRPVLEDVTLRIGPGQVVGLAGANGSGKSTLVKILAGYHHADAGEVAVGGTQLPRHFRSQDAYRAGIRFVHQDKGFVSGMSVLDNLALGHGYAGGRGRIDWSAERRVAAAELDEHNVLVRLDADAASLSAADRAKLAIIRALRRRVGEERRVLVLDEATAAMGADESRLLGEWLQKIVIKEQLGMLFVGHRPDELREISDEVAVLRAGRLVSVIASGEATDEGIVEAIVGASLDSFYPPRIDMQPQEGRRLVVRGLSGSTVRGIDLTVNAGEIVGVTGIEGSGFEEIPYLLFDTERAASGSVTIDGIESRVGRVPIATRLRQGMVLIPSDRIRRGVIDRMTIRENIVQPRLRHMRAGGFISSRRERIETRIAIDKFDVVPADSEARIGSMSGGNQQKVLLGKWLATDPGVLLLHEPTEGIDVRTKKEIFRVLGEQAQLGRAVLVASVEYEDLAHICDRILVIGDGRVHSELSGAELTGPTVMNAAYVASITSPRASW
ncbi:sugar ABC transporter ATP-binding protein [Glaciihabitans sp. UYNi722]|uniref:sugar ABC transporter ATP-binding protein n=1 Tax=Glaciihabitans sp. UYNi722 TaxID=3156344 RepID=UPI00339A7CA4